MAINTYKIVDTLWGWISKMSFRKMYYLSDFIFFLLYHVFRYRRKLVRKNLQDSFPERKEKEIKDIERKFYHHFCDYIVETIKTRDIDEKRIQKHIRFDNTEILYNYLSQKKSVVMYLSHSFNWEWVTALNLLSTDENVCYGQIYHPLTNPVFDKLFYELRTKYGSQNMSMKTTLRSIMKILQEGKCYAIGFIADQVPYWEAIDHWITFLNHKDTPVFGGGEKIARRTNAAAIFISVHKESRGHYVATIHDLTSDAKSLPEHQLTEMYFKKIEEFLNEHPENWLWAHRRWKRTRAMYEKWQQDNIKIRG